jgi:methyl-accepting chemotaxis protein
VGDGRRIAAAASYDGRQRGMTAFLDNTRIKWKLAIAPVLIVAAAVVLGGLAWRMTAAQDNALDTLYHQSFSKKQMVGELGTTLVAIDAGLYRSITWQNAGADDKTVKQSIDATLKQLDGITARLDALDKTIGSAEGERATLAEVRTAATAFSKKSREVLDMLDGDPVMAVTLLRQAERLYTKVEQAVAAWSELQTRENDSLFDQTRVDSHNSLVAFFLIMAAAFGAAVALILLVGYGISSGINLMTLVMTRLAAGDNDVIVPDSGRRDEIGDMARAVQVFKDNALENERLRQAQEGEQHRMQDLLKSEMLNLSEVLEGEVATTVGDISTQAERLSEGANQLSATAQKLRETAQSVSAAIQTTSGNVQTVAGATEELEASSRGISKQIQSCSRLTDDARDKVDLASSSVGGLTEASARIANVVTLIQTIAGQTRMLALNATIEAARAGDAGKGFAVVAEEVKGLAHQTEDGIGKVNAQADEIGRTTREAVGTVEAVAATIREIEAITAQVANSAEQQRAATAEIMDSAVQAAGHTQDVADHAQSMLHEADLTGLTARKVTELSARVSREIGGLQNRLNVILRNSYGGNRRNSERTPVSIQFTGVLDGHPLSGFTGDISSSGALLMVTDSPPVESGQGTLELEGVGSVPIHLLVNSGLGLHVRFLSLTETQKAALTAAVDHARVLDGPAISLAQQVARDAGAAFERALQMGELSEADLFNTEYEPIDGSNPPQFIAKHTAFADRVLPALIEAPLASSSHFVFCCVSDHSGYIATHNKKYSQPQRPDEVDWNTANSRNRRVYDDRTAIIAARNVKPFLAQTYIRVMGQGQSVVLKEIDTPIMVAGKHWGTVRLAMAL